MNKHSDTAVLFFFLLIWRALSRANNSFPFLFADSSVFSREKCAMAPINLNSSHNLSNTSFPLCILIMFYPRISQSDERDLTLAARDLKKSGARDFAIVTARRYIDQNGLDPSSVKCLARKIVRCMKNLESFVCTRKYHNNILTPTGNQK